MSPPSAVGEFRRTVTASVVAGPLNDPVGFFRALGQPAPPATVTPIVWETEWPWASPLPAILRGCGWDIDAVVSSREVAVEMRRIWKVWKAAERMRAEKRFRHEIAERVWQRRQGCPVPCPLCGALEDCACAGALESPRRLTDWRRVAYHNPASAARTPAGPRPAAR